MIKEKYEIAEIDVHVFEAEDIITTSDASEFDPDPNEGNPVGG